MIIFYSALGINLSLVRGHMYQILLYHPKDENSFVDEGAESIHQWNSKAEPAVCDTIPEARGLRRHQGFCSDETIFAPTNS
jgi:hypothetical protein